MADSLSGVNYSAFAPPAPSRTAPLDYFQQGYGTVQDVIDSQFRARLQQENLKRAQAQAEMDALLGPIKLQSAQQQLAQDALLDPIRARQAQLSLEQNQAELDAYKLNNAPLPFLGQGGSGIVSPGSISPAPIGAGAVSNISAPDADGYHLTLGTTFATPRDLEKFSRSGSLANGDNGIGAWGDKTTGSTPYVALPPAYFRARGINPNKAHNMPVMVEANGRTVQALVGDKMPDNAKNGAGLDLNGATASALGIADPDNFKGQVRFKIGAIGAPTSALPTLSAPIVAASAPAGQADEMVAVISPSNARGFVPRSVLDQRLASGYKLADNASAEVLSSPMTPIGERPTSSPISRRVVPGYIDPETQRPVAEPNRRNVPPGATYGRVSVPVYSPTQAKQDERDRVTAQKIGLDPTIYAANEDDPNGSLTPQGRTDLKRDIAARNKELADAKISEGADGQLHLSQDAIEDYATRSLLDPSVRFAGLGKVAAGANIEIANRRAEIQKETGMTGTDAYVAQQGVAASKLALRDQEKKRANIVGFEQTARKNAQIALELMNKGAGGGAPIPVFNRWLQAGRKGTGDPEVAAFNTAIGAFTNEYAKIISGNTGAGGATDASRREAAELINKGGTVEQLRAQLDVAFREMENRTTSIDEQISRLNESIRTFAKPKGQADEASPEAKVATPATADMVQMRSPSGKLGMVPAGQAVEDAKAKGFTVVQ